MTSGCRYSNCDYFCFADGLDNFKCGCPNYMIYNVENKKCQCIEDNNCHSWLKII